MSEHDKQGEQETPGNNAECVTFHLDFATSQQAGIWFMTGPTNAATPFPQVTLCGDSLDMMAEWLQRLAGVFITPFASGDFQYVIEVHAQQVEATFTPLHDGAAVQIIGMTPLPETEG